MATGDGDPIFVDTNVLIYANLARSPLHQMAQGRLTAFDEQGIELWISRQVLREYLAAMTRRGDLTGEIPMASLIGDVRYFASRFLVAEDSPAILEKLLDLLGLDFGHSGIRPLQTRQERAGAVWKFGEV